MGILDELAKESVWLSFLQYKKEKRHLNRREEAELEAFIFRKGYLSFTGECAEFHFGYPTKKLINKVNSTKKRVVYSFSEDESMVLKGISYLLYRYDSFFSDDLYSFRVNTGAKRAVKRLTATSSIDLMYGYKVDISNYFNSIDISILLPILESVLKDDADLFHFFEQLLTRQGALFEGQLITEEAGIMAGTPTSPFLANLYLTELDRLFEMKEIPYCRYSDDIIFFCQTEQERNKYVDVLKTWLADHHLTVNHDKEYLIQPGEEWEFLGVCYRDKSVDLSAATVDKMKGKIRRKARSVYRWSMRKGVPCEKAMKLLIKEFNRKLFEEGANHELTWARWFFPLLTTDQGLHEIDAYLQQNIRYLATGRYGKTNYQTDYKTLKRLGYRSLVNEYYKRGCACK